MKLSVSVIANFMAVVDGCHSIHGLSKTTNNFKTGGTWESVSNVTFTYANLEWYFANSSFLASLARNLTVKNIGHEHSIRAHGHGVLRPWPTPRTLRPWSTAITLSAMDAECRKREIPTASVYGHVHDRQPWTRTRTVLYVQRRPALFYVLLPANCFSRELLKSEYEAVGTRKNRKPGERKVLLHRRDFTLYMNRGYFTHSYVKMAFSRR